ncbi:type II toxin-antitoxin system VapC family toxin [Sphingomonas sp. Y38-1Y]|uniref:type II toxin-antitoxin system VapC family toxin n=1 Tax=Sphingomonas sp. Y38-1Y TaxID=3078265 RepID=UPI0028E25619|nr:type II toxin-antitoxin system VapC family toxin [Sphingomonas sp. Y38-1Y]
MSVVLDASAILAVLLDEPGRERVLPVMTGAFVSSVNLGEVLSRAVDQGFDVDQTASGLARLEMQIMPFAHADAIEAARLRLTTKRVGASLGDRACLALAQRLRLPVLTADRAWSSLGLAVEIVQIR